MIEPLSGLPEGVIGFEAVGEIEASDYQDVLGPAVEKAAASGPVRLVYVLGDRFESYSGGAAWQDLEFGIKHMRPWEKIAVVSDEQWVERLASAFGWMMPGEFRHFALAERDEAIAWAAGTS